MRLGYHTCFHTFYDKKNIYISWPTLVEGEPEGSLFSSYYIDV